MTRQTSEPLAELRSTASSREAREVARWVTSGEAILDEVYQRSPVWTEDQQIALVRSWLQSVPIPAIVVNERDEPYGWTGPDTYLYAIIDGQQRVRTAIDWFAGNLAIPASWLPPQALRETEQTGDGTYVRYTGLAIEWRRHLGHRFQLPVISTRLPTVQAEAQVYLLVNGGGTPQSDQDMARADAVANRSGSEAS